MIRTSSLHLCMFHLSSFHPNWSTRSAANNSISIDGDCTHLMQQSEDFNNIVKGWGYTYMISSAFCHFPGYPKAFSYSFYILKDITLGCTRGFSMLCIFKMLSVMVEWYVWNNRYSVLPGECLSFQTQED